MFNRIKQLFTYSQASIGFGIRFDAILSVLTGSAQLPTLSQLVNPKGAQGAVAGKIAPLAAGTGRDALDKPFEQEGYAVASLDSKTLLKMVIVSKETANFDPLQVLQSEFGGHLDDEIQRRVAATWHIVQLGFQSHDPAVVPSLDFQWQIANRMAALTDGVIGDPITMQYKLPDLHPGTGFDSERHVETVITTSPPGVCTLGLMKFDLPELRISCEQSVEEAARLALARVVAGIFERGPVAVGGQVGSPHCPWTAMVSTEGTMELVPPPGKSHGDCITAWLISQ